MSFHLLLTALWAVQGRMDPGPFATHLEALQGAHVAALVAEKGPEGRETATHEQRDAHRVGADGPFGVRFARCAANDVLMLVQQDAVGRAFEGVLGAGARAILDVVDAAMDDGDEERYD